MTPDRLPEIKFKPGHQTLTKCICHSLLKLIVVTRNSNIGGLRVTSKGRGANDQPIKNKKATNMQDDMVAKLTKNRQIASADT